MRLALRTIRIHNEYLHINVIDKDNNGVRVFSRVVLVMQTPMRWRIWGMCVEGEEIISNSAPSIVNVIVFADSSANK